MRLFYFFPIKRKKVFFSSFEGKQFSCNPKYIYLKLRQTDGDNEYVFEYNDVENAPRELADTILVKHNSLKYFFHILTAKVVVSNNAISPKIPIRRSQYVINTWHGGGAFKKVGIDISSKINGIDRNLLKISARQTDLFLASSRGFYDGTGKGSCIPLEKVLFVGMPRNDILFSDQDEKKKIRQTVRDYFGVNHSDKLLLYAPTFRGGIGSVEQIHGDDLDWLQINKALKKRFSGEWKLIIRGHYHTNHTFDIVNDLIDATDYPDMQELIIASDAMITDYSSVIWDYSFTDKPGFLYCPDLINYVNERDFYSPIDCWPYPYAENNHDLCEIIEKCNQKEINKRCVQYHLLMNSFEDGLASTKVTKIVQKNLI